MSGTDRKLSTLEMSVLGLAWLRGPCTTYTLMKELSASRSSYYKSRAGATYSVTKRLLTFGLIEQDPTAEQENHVRITAEGTRALMSWVAPPIPPMDIAHSADLVRLRFFFLGVIDQSARLAFIDQAVAGLERFLEECLSLIRANEEIGDYYGALATVSTVYETRGRISWLKLVRKWVEEPMRSGVSWTDEIMSELS